MKKSPLQLSAVHYSNLTIKAVPERSGDVLEQDLPVEVESIIFLDSDGVHYASVAIRQKDDTFPYLLDVEAFATFTLDIDGCREAYKTQFRPEVIAVNVARIIFSSARDMVATVSARFPYEGARVPTLILEPQDVSVRFEKEKTEQILIESFGVTQEAIDEAKALAVQQGASVNATKADKAAAKRAVKKRG